MKPRTRLWAAALAALSIAPYGNIGTLLGKQNPWRAFRAEDPVLTAIRAERLKGADCAKLTAALVGDSRGIVPIRVSAPGNPQAQNWGTWTPLTNGELDAIRDCDDFPCAVKLDWGEVGEMKGVSKENRPAKFLTIVLDRMRAYLATGARKPYEFAGGIADPWALFERRGLKSALAMPTQPELGERVLDFHQSRMRPIRQILDRRTALSAGQATVWVRDVYTDHYFDSWGEWGNVQCDLKTHDAIVTLALSIELDLLKKHDFLSAISKGSMRSSVEKLATQYLDRWAGEL